MNRRRNIWFRKWSTIISITLSQHLEILIFCWSLFFFVHSFLEMSQQLYLFGSGFCSHLIHQPPEIKVSSWSVHPVLVTQVLTKRFWSLFTVASQIGLPPASSSFCPASTTVLQNNSHCGPIVVRSLDSMTWGTRSQTKVLTFRQIGKNLCGCSLPK